MGRLTLSIDDDVMRAAKRLARREKTSVSAVIRDILREIAASSRQPDDVRQTPQPPG